jgi:hypothetical protein
LSWHNAQPGQFGSYAQDVLGNTHVGPGGGAGEPRVAGLAKARRLGAVGELAVDVGLDLVEFGLVVVFGGQEAAVVLVGAVAAAQEAFGHDGPRVRVAEDPAVYRCRAFKG